VWGAWLDPVTPVNAAVKILRITAPK